jgi:hypothetical protein
MSLPPIIANLPFIKPFIKDSAEDKQAAANKPAANGAQATSLKGDVSVQISKEAQAKLAAKGAKGAKDENDARKITTETKDLLSKDQVSLGLDPDFS